MYYFGSYNLKKFIKEEEALAIKTITLLAIMVNILPFFKRLLHFTFSERAMQWLLV